MESKNICSRVCLVLIFCSLSWFATAQTNKDNNKDLLLGEWVLEEASVHETNDIASVNIDSIDIEFHREIEIRSDELSFNYKGVSQKNKYEVTGDWIYLNFATISFYAEWAILNNKLYIEWAQDIPISDNENKTMVVLLIYKRK